MKTHAAVKRLLEHRSERLDAKIGDVFVIAQHGVESSNDVVRRNRFAIGVDLARREVQGARVHASVTGGTDHLVAFDTSTREQTTVGDPVVPTESRIDDWRT